MQGVRQFGNALTIALLSVALVLGGLSLALVEYSSPAPLAPTDVVPPSPIPLTATATLPPPLESPTFTSTALPSATPSPPASCPVPTGWVRAAVQAGDTLEGLAVSYRTTAETLRQANCLLTDSLVVNSIIYVPNVPANTTAACIPGATGWVRNYTVRPGDTIYRIATQYFTDTATLKRVNCRTTDRINVGELLWVPNRATRTPIITTTPAVAFTFLPTELLTQTTLPFTLTPAPTNTLPPATVTPSETTAPTATPSVTAFPTVTP